MLKAICSYGFRGMASDLEAIYSCWGRRNSSVDYPLQMVLLIFQIKVNSVAIVRMKSMDGGPYLTVDRGVSAAEGPYMCSVEQVCHMPFILSVLFSGSNISSCY